MEEKAAEKEKGKHYLASKSQKTKFEHYPLKEEVIALLNDNNFKKPTLVQAESLPITLQDNLRNLCAIIYAYNGAGKTLTYLIPIFNALENIPATGQKFEMGKEHEIGRPQAVIVVPTEALLAQVYDYLMAYADFYEMTYKWNIKIGRIYSKVYEHGHIIVGMPKKVQQKFAQTTNFDLSELKWVVFDECDQLKEDSLHEFTDLLRDPRISTSQANVSLPLLSF
jgi:superfamily II DNA/RNA helicase